VKTRFPTAGLKDVFDSYELCFIKEREKKYEAAEGELLSIELKEEEGISLRGIKDGKMAFSYTFEKGEKAVEALIENGRLILPFLETDRFQAFPRRQDVYPGLALYDEDGLKVSDERKISALIEMESIIRGSDRRITTTRNCELHESAIEIGILNSNGLEVEGRKTVYALSGMAVAAEGGDEVSWYDWVWSTRYDALDSQALGRRIGERTVSFLAGQILDTGVYAGLLPPGCACQLLEILSPSFLGENLFKNKTRLKEKTGSQVMSNLLTLADAGTRGIGAFPFDGEGVPSRTNILVKEGVFQGFLYDTYYGNVLGRPSTGNSERSGVKDPPRCGSRGFFFETGSGTGLEDFDNGVIIDELMGTHTANTVTGDFSVGAIGHYCHGGSRIPFKGVILAGNLFEVLSNVRAVGNDLTFYGSYGSPTLLIEGLRISGK
jgi:PmbA protein